MLYLGTWCQSCTYEFVKGMSGKEYVKANVCRNILRENKN